MTVTTTTPVYQDTLGMPALPRTSTTFGDQLEKLAKSLGLSSADVGRLLGVKDSTVRMYKHRNSQPDPQSLDDLMALARERGVEVDLEYFYLSECDPEGYAPKALRDQRAQSVVGAGKDVTVALVVTALAQNLRALARSVLDGRAAAAEARARLSHAAAVCEAAVPALDDGQARTALVEASELLRV